MMKHSETQRRIECRVGEGQKDMTVASCWTIRFTMQGHFYRDVFSKAGIDLIIPEVNEQAYIHDIYIMADRLIKCLKVRSRGDAAELGNFIFEFVKIPSENPPGMDCRTRPASLGLDLLLVSIFVVAGDVVCTTASKQLTDSMSRQGNGQSKEHGRRR